jgi:hypothetical protein
METEKTYRIVGCNGRRERTCARGLTRAQAEAKRDEMRRDPLCRGFSISIEEEKAAQYWAGFVAAAGQVHGR